VSNSCSLTLVGSINGFAQSLVALLRAFSPAIAGMREMKRKETKEEKKEREQFVL
jgi:hypothetical protein